MMKILPPRQYPRGWSIEERCSGLKIAYIVLEGGKVFVPWVTLPNASLSFLDVVQYMVSVWPRGVLMHGLDDCHLDCLQANRGQYLCLGMTTCLSTQEQFPPSVNALVRRGARGASVCRESGRSKDTFEVRQPRLRYLFRPLIEDQCERFLVCHGDILSGALLLTRTGHYAHIEEFWRDVRAPVGTMEYLLNEVRCFLQQESVSWLDLGEVPFHMPAHDHSVGRGSLYNGLLRTLCALPLSNYSLAGLLKFKQKFGQSFLKSYWYSTTRLTELDLLRIGVATNADAVLFGLFHKALRIGMRGLSPQVDYSLETLEVPLPLC